jgi:hypothetical protein
MLHFAQEATRLSRDPHGVLALFATARLGDHQDAIGGTYLLGHELMVVPPHLLLIPDHITEQPLHPTAAPPLDVEGHRLDRLAFERTQLPHHRVEAMGPRLTTGKTVMEGRLKLPQFLYEPFHIAGYDLKRRHGKSFAVGPTGW